MLPSDMPATLIHWCSFCNENPSDGTLTVEDLAGQIMELQACLGCKTRLELQTELAGNPETN